MTYLLQPIIRRNEIHIYYAYDVFLELLWIGFFSLPHNKFQSYPASMNKISLNISHLIWMLFQVITVHWVYLFNGGKPNTVAVLSVYLPGGIFLAVF